VLDSLVEFLSSGQRGKERSSLHCEGRTKTGSESRARKKKRGKSSRRGRHRHAEELRAEKGILWNLRIFPREVPEQEGAGGDEKAGSKFSVLEKRMIDDFLDGKCCSS